MNALSSLRESELYQLRLMLEEVCCDLCRFRHQGRDRCCPEAIQIDREFPLGAPGAFADIRVLPATGKAYFVEIKYGYSMERLRRHLRRKYGKGSPIAEPGCRLVLVIDLEGRPQAERFAAELADCLDERLELELWDEPRLLTLMRECFQTEFKAITADHLLDLRDTIDRAKGFHAFGAASPAAYVHDPLKAQMLWHFGFWRLRQLRETGRLTPEQVLPPGTYRGVTVVVADLSSFSSFVRDTPEADIVAESLTAFYSKSRYQIINSGGMLYQFVGDQVIGFFGIPEPGDGVEVQALATARALSSIGESVSLHWQRRIDRIQTGGGVHIGMATGDLQIVSLRPFSRSHIGALGDCINVASRLMTVARPGEIVISNSLCHQLSEQMQAQFSEIEPVEAGNVGRIKAWRLAVAPQ